MKNNPKDKSDKCNSPTTRLIMTSASPNYSGSDAIDNDHVVFKSFFIFIIKCLVIYFIASFQHLYILN